ncbi:hypothetical protein BJ742DRAFT_859752 [Cladochytrium replicatum]|nr:hypothetical protein BJ742DRAFT_859752 [Cladochytrium replicatum]
MNRLRNHLTRLKICVVNYKSDDEVKIYCNLKIISAQHNMPSATKQQHESMELSNVSPSSASQPIAAVDPKTSVPAVDELPPGYLVDVPNSTQTTSTPSSNGSRRNETTASAGDSQDATAAHVYTPPPALDTVPPDALPPSGELLPSYTYVTAPPPKYSEKNIFKLLRSRELRMTIVALFLLGVAIAVAIVTLLNQSRQYGPSPTILNVRDVFSISFPGASIGANKWRHMAGSEFFGIAVIEKVPTINGANALVAIRNNNTRLFGVPTGTTISYMAPYSADTFFALATTTNGTVNLVQYNISSEQGTPISVFNLTNITSSAFVHPVVEASMYLSNNALNNSYVFVAMGDSNSTTWLYRIRVPAYIVERNGTIGASARGTYRFAETVGFPDSESNELVSSILMLPSAPAPTIFDAYAMLQPQNLSLLLPVNRDSSSYVLFLGAPFRGSLSTAGTAGMVMGDKALVAANSAELTRNFSVGSIPGFRYGQVFNIYPRDWGQSYNSYIGGNLTEVLVHMSGEYTIRGVDRTVDLRGTANNSTSSATAIGSAEIGFEVESLANAGQDAFYAIGVNRADVVIKKFKVSKSSS